MLPKYLVKMIFCRGTRQTSSEKNLCVQVDHVKKLVYLFNDPIEMELKTRGILISETKKANERVILCNFEDDRENSTIHASLEGFQE